MRYPRARYASMMYPQDYGLPKINKYAQNPQNVSTGFETNMMHATQNSHSNYQNSKNYFKPIIVSSSKRPNDTVLKDKKFANNEGTFLDPVVDIPIVPKEKTNFLLKPPTGFLPYQPNQDDKRRKFKQESLSSIEQDFQIENMDEKVISEQNKLFDVLEIIKDSKNSSAPLFEEKYKRFSMNNFDELKKAEEHKKDLKAKYSTEKFIEVVTDANLNTFQKLNKNLCKGKYIFSF